MDNKKAIYLISFRNYDYDGRLRALVDVFKQLGELYLLSGGSKSNDNLHYIYNGNYLGFIKKAIEIGGKIENIDYLVMDNRKSTIPGLYIMKRKKPQVSILDCRELYIITEKKKLASKIGCLFEKVAARKSDIVLCANQKRADIMMKLYDLRSKPLVYENLRCLNYTSDAERKKAENKYKKFFAEDEFRIISSSGCLLDRTNDILVRNMKLIDQKCRLFLVGESPKTDVESIKKIVLSEKLENVEILGLLSQDELKYLISNSHIGVVNYNQLDTNNKYCASGKLYEFIYEGIPVVCTTNPPLREICERYHVGVADDEYYNGINDILLRYEEYRHSVSDYSATHTIEMNERMFIEQLTTRLTQLNR